MPATLVLARGLTAWIEWMAEDAMADDRAAALVAASLLASFYVNYFSEFATTGGRSHLTYVTAAIEPKQQALEHILASGRGPAASWSAATMVARTGRSPISPRSIPTYP